MAPQKSLGLGKTVDDAAAAAKKLAGDALKKTKDAVISATKSIKNTYNKVVGNEPVVEVEEEEIDEDAIEAQKELTKEWLCINYKKY